MIHHAIAILLHLVYHQLLNKGGGGGGEGEGVVIFLSMPCANLQINGLCSLSRVGFVGYPMLQYHQRNWQILAKILR